MGKSYNLGQNGQTSHAVVSASYLCRPGQMKLHLLNSETFVSVSAHTRTGRDEKTHTSASETPEGLGGIIQKTHHALTGLLLLDPKLLDEERHALIGQADAEHVSLGCAGLPNQEGLSAGQHA